MEQNTKNNKTLGHLKDFSEQFGKNPFIVFNRAHILKLQKNVNFETLFLLNEIFLGLGNPIRES